MKSDALPIRFGIPQGSVLDTIMFSFFSKDLPDIAHDCDSEIHMHADDTSIYVSAPSPEMVTDTLNKFYTWCRGRRILPHAGKTRMGHYSLCTQHECIILMHGRFIDPMQAIKQEIS